MGEIFTVADIRRNSGWREALEERQNYERQRREREQAQARKGREGEVKQQAALNDWWVPIDERIRAHFKDWAWAAIDERIQQWWDAKSEPLKDGIGRALGTIREQLRKEFRHAIGEAVDAFGKEIAALERRLLSTNQAALVSWVDGREATLAHVRDEFKCSLEEQQRSFETKLAAVEERLKAVPGKLPVSKIWREESVTYGGEVLSFHGSLWQACKDTAQTPGDSDWICVARAGRDGLTPNFCGLYDAYRKYQQFDVVEFDGSSFIAVRDLDPGTIPGEDGWQLLCRPGSRGPSGEVGPRGRKGERGARGEDAPTITLWTIDRKRYRAIPTLSNGKMGAPLELRPLFEQYQLETSDAILS
jgi:hypothetical protein